MTRNVFEQYLRELRNEILRLGGLVEQAVYQAVEAFLQQDVTLAAEVIMGDERIDQLYQEIEDRCVKLIATQQPIARDLRIAITGIKILLSLERMGDHAVDIARATMCLSGQALQLCSIPRIPQMAGIVRHMIKEGLDAYVHRHVDKARDMCALDDEVDFIFSHVFKETLQCMEEQPELVVQGGYLLYVVRYLERIADHATNIGEAVIYLETGERRELN